MLSFIDRDNQKFLQFSNDVVKPTPRKNVHIQLNKEQSLFKSKFISGRNWVHSCHDKNGAVEMD